MAKPVKPCYGWRLCLPFCISVCKSRISFQEQFLVVLRSFFLRWEWERNPDRRNITFNHESWFTSVSWTARLKKTQSSIHYTVNAEKEFLERKRFTTASKSYSQKGSHFRKSARELIQSNSYYVLPIQTKVFSPWNANPRIWYGFENCSEDIFFFTVLNLLSW